jgi:ACS family pantothenate transporter-like MFS transporter
MVQVAGLRESLNMSGHDYNNVLSVTTAGYVLHLELSCIL